MARTLAQVDARLTTEITTRTGQLAGTSGSVLLDRLNALEARVKKLESPVITPVPPVQVPSGPLDFTADGQVIENKIIDIAPGRAITWADQIAARSSSIYGKGKKGCILRNVTLRGRSWGALLVDMDDLQLIDVTVLDVDYCGIGIFSGARGKIIRPIVQRIGMLRTDFTTNQGWQNNAYGIKFEKGANGGGVGPAPADWIVDHPLVEDVPLWQGINAHDGDLVTIQDGVIRRVPRPVFIAGQVARFTIVRNTLLEPVTKPGGTQDKTAISYGNLQGALIDGNQIDARFTGKISNIDQYSGGTSHVTIGTNPIV